MAGYFVVISFLILPVFIFIILFNKKKKKKKRGSWIILCYFNALSRLSSGTYIVRWSQTRKLNFSILARQYFAGFYFRDFNRQIWTEGIKFRDSSVLNVTLMFVKSELFLVLDKVEQAKRIFIDSIRVIFATFTTESYRRYKIQLRGCLYGGRKILEGGSSLPVRYKDMRKPPSNRIN